MRFDLGVENVRATISEEVFILPPRMTVLRVIGEASMCACVCVRACCACVRVRACMSSDIMNP